MLAHLLGAVPFSLRQNKNVFHLKTRHFGYFGKDRIHGYRYARVPDVIIDHEHRSTMIQYSMAFLDNATHFIKITFDHTNDRAVIKLFFILLIFQIIQYAL